MLSGACTLFVTSRWSTRLPSWSPSISAEDAATIVTCLDVGAFVAFLPGAAYDSAGPKVVACAGAGLTLAGYMGLYAAVASPAHVPLAVLCALGFTIGQGSIWTVMPALNVVTCNFDQAGRGRAVGLVMTTFGLSAGIFSDTVTLFEGAHAHPSLLLILGIGMSSITVLSAAGLARLPRGRPPVTAKAAWTGEALLVCLVFLTLVTAPVFVRESAHVCIMAAVVLYCVVLAFQLALVVRLGARKGVRSLICQTMDDLGFDPVVQLAATGNGHGETEDATLGGALRTMEYWLLLFVFLVAIGIGQTVSNTVGDIPALGDSNAGLAVFAAGNSLGRLAPGYLSDRLSGHCSRVGFVLISTIILLVAQLIMVFQGHAAWLEYLGVFLSAFAFGSYWVLVPAAEAEWFGRRHFGKIHGLLLFLAGDGGVLLLYKGVSTVADSWVGPCRESSRKNNCFAFQWQCCLSGSMFALAAAVVLSNRLRRRTGRDTRHEAPAGPMLRVADRPAP